MKTFIFTLVAIAAFTLNLKAQEGSADVISVTSSPKPTYYKDTVKVQKDQDTTIVRIGKKDVKVINHDGGTEILWSQDSHKKNKSDKFKGHWQGFEMGFNGFDQADYSMYEAKYKDFMSLNQGKSWEIGLNCYEFDISLYKSVVGLISGMGLSFNDYKFENRYTIQRTAERTVPVPLEYTSLDKTKLSVSYLNVPLLIEFQIPVNEKEGKLYLNAGFVGGVKLGSHTKVKHDGTKDKDRSGFNINSFKYDACVRIGYKDIGLFAKYSLTPLFKTGKGPELTPFTIGISFLD
jgi:hypothetical protein